MPQHGYPSTTGVTARPDHWRTLTTRHLWVLLLSTHLPLTLLWAIVPNALQAGQVVATPLIFLMSGVVLLSFVACYTGLAKRLRHPGGLYVQVVHGLGRSVGIGVAAVSLVGYLGLGAILFQFFALSMNSVSTYAGVSIPTWAWIVMGMTVVCGLGFLRPRALIPAIVVVAAVQAAIVVVFLGKAFTTPAGGEVAWTGLDPSWLLSGSFGAAIAYAMTAMVGTEIGVTFNNELISPQRSLPRASFLAYGMMTIVLAVCAFAVGVTGGPEQVTHDAAGHGTPLMAMIVGRLAGPKSAAAVLHGIVAVTAGGVLINALILQAAIARQLAGLSRDGILPKRLSANAGQTRVRAGLIVFFPLVAGSVALVVGHLNDELPLWLTIGSGLAVLSTLMLASVAAFVWFLRGDDETDRGFFGWEGHVIAAAFATVTIGFAFFYGITHISSLGPGAPNGAGWVIAAMIVVPFAAGAGTALVIRRLRPEAFATIGRLGDRAAPHRPTVGVAPANAAYASQR